MEEPGACDARVFMTPLAFVRVARMVTAEGADGLAWCGSAMPVRARIVVRATISLFFRNVAREAFKVFKVRTPRKSHMPPDADAGSELRDMSSDRIG